MDDEVGGDKKGMMGEVQDSISVSCGIGIVILRYPGMQA